MSGEGSTVLILGGYGMAGRLIAKLLLEHSAASIVVAGRSYAKARAAVDELGAPSGERASAARADAASAESLAEAFDGVDWVVDCTPTTENVATTTHAALAAGANYLDILYGPDKMPVLEALTDRVSAQGKLFITEAGYHPGLPSALVRYAAAELEGVDSAIVGGLLNHPMPFTEAVVDLIRELENMDASDFSGGSWRSGSWSRYREIDFGPPYGRRQCYAMGFRELRGLPERYSLDEMGFYMAGWGWAIDWGVFVPWYMFKLGRVDWGARLGAKLLCWLSKRVVRPPFGVVLKLEATGTLGGRPAELTLFLSHPDGYMLTAIPVVACLRQVLDGSIADTGLHMMGHVVDPVTLVNDMKAMGVQVRRELMRPQTQPSQARGESK